MVRLREVLKKELCVTPREYVYLLDYALQRQGRDLTLSEVEERVIERYNESRTEVEKLIASVKIKSLEAIN